MDRLALSWQLINSGLFFFFYEWHCSIHPVVSMVHAIIRIINRSIRSSSRKKTQCLSNPTKLTTQSSFDESLLFEVLWASSFPLDVIVDDPFFTTTCLLSYVFKNWSRSKRESHMTMRSIRFKCGIQTSSLLVYPSAFKMILHAWFLTRSEFLSRLASWSDHSPLFRRYRSSLMILLKRGGMVNPPCAGSWFARTVTSDRVQ